MNWARVETGAMERAQAFKAAFAAQARPGSGCDQGESLFAAGVMSHLR